MTMAGINDRSIDRRTVIKGMAGLAIVGTLAGCNDEEVDPETDPGTQRADPAADR